MTSKTFCDPCSRGSKTAEAIRYCSDCEENICNECIESHSKFKVFLSHHLIDLKTTGARIPPSAKKYCETHEDVLLDFYCTQHDSTCCRACIPEYHQSCKNVTPLEFASKDVRKSSLLADTLQELTNIDQTLQHLLENRDTNLKNLDKSESSILQQVSHVKVRLLKHVDDLERKLINELADAKKKNEGKLKTEKVEISKLATSVTDIKNELEFLKEHGSNNQLFLMLQQRTSSIQMIEKQVQEMTSTFQGIDMTFEEVNYPIIESFGSISEVIQSCDVKYRPLKLQQAQVQDKAKPFTKFEKVNNLNLKTTERYNLRGIAVTFHDKVLICNYKFHYPKVYVYSGYNYENEIKFSTPPYDIAVLPGTDRAVVTLPKEKSIQFVNTTNMTKENKVKLEEECYGVTTNKDRIFIGGTGHIHMLNTNGSHISKITTNFSDNIFFLCLKKEGDQLLCRSSNALSFMELSGKIVYQHTTRRTAGFAVDRLGYIYSVEYDSSVIQRLSSDGKLLDVALTKDDGIDHPYAIAFNNDFTKLFVVDNLESVFVYNCK